MTARTHVAEGGTQFLEALHPIYKLGELGEVAAAAAFLASSHASFVTGTAMPINGGHSAR
jgi:meso-butanediol dehydrogenase/(S,S)-butanediol dehydrogenase/diacetyl reductase